MNDYTRVMQEVEYKLKKGKIYSYFIQEDFSRDLKLIEIVDKTGQVIWNYFNKRTGEQQI